MIKKVKFQFREFVQLAIALSMVGLSSVFYWDDLYVQAAIVLAFAAATLTAFSVRFAALGQLEVIRTDNMPGFRLTGWSFEVSSLYSVLYCVFQFMAFMAIVLLVSFANASIMVLVSALVGVGGGALWFALYKRERECFVIADNARRAKGLEGAPSGTLDMVEAALREQIGHVQSGGQLAT